MDEGKIKLEDKSREVEEKFNEVEKKMREVEERMPKRIRFEILRPMLGLLIITVGLLSGIILVQERQIISKKAAENVFFSDSFEGNFPGSNWFVSGSGHAMPNDSLKKSGLRSLKVTSSGTLEAVTHDFGSDRGGSFVIHVYDDNTDNSRGAVVSVSNSDASQYLILSIPSTGDQYAYRMGGSTFNSGISRSAGWHKFEFVVTSGGTYARIDDTSLFRSISGETENDGLNRTLTAIRKLYIGRTWLSGDSYFDDIGVF